ncbi:MAG TPA: type II secretion system protein GspC [Candidatus Margulisiibacteriota bacterium]|nr:type II secretion system protein GspC [Candidatus Margulisiibacteriota bacterium]
MKISPRHLVWVNLALLAMVAYWGASTVSTAIAARLTPSPEVHLSPPPPPLAREPKRPASYYAAIQSRDIFNSAKPEPEKPKEPPKPTELKLKLWGVVVHADGSSYCVIEDLTTRKQDLYRISDSVAGSAVVKQIEWDRVILDRDGKDEILELSPPQGGGPAPAGVAPARALPPGAAPGAAVAPPGVPGQPGQPGQSAQSGQNPHIRQVGENQYQIDKSEVDAALDNMNQLFTQVRAVPHFEGGKSVGFRLFAIRQGSIFDEIGLKNGDVIQQVNGSDLSDPAKALALFQQLRNEQNISVNVLRNKENMTLNYQFQ